MRGVTEELTLEERVSEEMRAYTTEDGKVVLFRVSEHYHKFREAVGMYTPQLKTS